ncbi:hypothetical protein CesoFtcFv8_012038 [Champsocephalus esox]|uniref:Uncharacterized protein n=1 Tax=Champsocephalus esox TaxID=159716 RepID=A0AAN8GXW4_9TELE|nr:hypothetical protein CesoFtcFv8_012038 [Champsocephalus esox]
MYLSPTLLFTVPQRLRRSHPPPTPSHPSCPSRPPPKPPSFAKTRATCPLSHPARHRPQLFRAYREPLRASLSVSHTRRADPTNNGPLTEHPSSAHRTSLAHRP